MKEHNITAVRAATLLALVAVAGCRPKPSSTQQVENWS